MQSAFISLAVAIIATPFNTCMNVSKIGLGCLFSEYHHYFPIKDVAHNYFEMLSSLFSATSVSCNHAFVRHPHCNLDSFFLLECFYLFLVELFWNAQLLDTGAPIARDWVVTALGVSATLVSYNQAFSVHSYCNLERTLQYFYICAK